MHDVIAHAHQRSEALHAAGEVGQVIEDVVLVKMAMRSGVDVDHPRARRVLDNVRHIGGLTASEDVDIDVPRCQGSTQLADVAVIPALLPPPGRAHRTLIGLKTATPRRPPPADPSYETTCP